MLDLKNFGIEMWEEEKIASFSQEINDLSSMMNINAACLGVEQTIHIISGFLRLCCSRLGWTL